jgi:hypothetical protein
MRKHRERSQQRFSPPGGSHRLHRARHRIIASVNHRVRRWDQPLLTQITATFARALADTEEAILASSVTFREPDRDVHQHDLAWWLAQEERMEIRAELATSGLL